MTWALEVEHPLRGDRCIRRYRLSNGLRVILLSDPAAPIISYQTWFRVGSRHEQPGVTGIAHLFEHLMFNETERYALGEFDRLVESTGGDSNAATWVDWTHYRTSLPANALPLAIALESERMHQLKLETKQLESEREVVVNERIMRVDDDIDGFLDEQLFRLAFTKHPYQWPTIGWMQDIRSIDLETIRRFYKRHYTPDNASIVLVGDIDPDPTLALIAKHYVTIPAAIASESAADPLHVDEPEQHSQRMKTFCKETATEQMVIGYKSPQQNHPDWVTLELAFSMLLGAGPTAPIFRTLVIEKELATSVGGGLLPFQDPGLLTISATMSRNTTAMETLFAIDEIIERYAIQPIAQSHLDKIRNCVETEFWASFSSADSKADALGHFETTLGDFRELFTIAKRLQTTSAADISRVIRDYLRPERRSIVIAKPA